MATEHVTQASWIQKRPGVLGGDPCIRNTRISVHGLVEWRRLGRTDEQIIASIVGLTQADLDAAWKYYEQNKEEIDDILRQEEEA